MILITTAGQVGAEAARVLTQRQQPVRILVRDPEKAAALAQAGTEVEAIAEDNARWLSLAAQGEGDYVTDDVPAILGRPARTFEQFATD
jgi:Trk K+ transport system NAD-binding subunit